MIPVLGQLFSVVGYVVMPTLRCNCEAGGVVTLVVHSRADGFLRTQDACPACKRTYTVGGFSAAENGQMQFAIEMSAPAPTLIAQ